VSVVAETVAPPAETLTLDGLHLVCLLVGPAGQIGWANAAGESLHDGPGRLGHIEELVPAESGVRVRALIEGAFERGESEGTIELLPRPESPARYLHLRLHRVLQSGCSPEHVVAQGWDVTALVLRQQELQVQTQRDPLTGVANRVAFLADLERKVARCQGTPDRVALVFADLDGFKDVNEQHGHDGGDRVLIEMAARFAGCLRSSDLLGRVGGDKFAVVCTSAADWVAVSAVMDRLRAIAAVPIRLPQGVVQVTVSLGATFAEPADAECGGTGALVARADIQMFRVKPSHRARTHA